MTPEQIAYAALERLAAGSTSGPALPPLHDAPKHTWERAGVDFLWECWHGLERLPEGVSFRSAR